MSFNNGLERKKFEVNQIKLRVEYLKTGMNEDFIRSMYEFDLGEFNSRRRFCNHTQSISPLAFAEGGEESGEKNPLFRKFLSAISNSMEDSACHSKYWWIEEISCTKLAKRIKSLSEPDLELLAKYALEGFSELEIAKNQGVTQQAVSKKIRRIKKYLRNS